MKGLEALGEDYMQKRKTIVLNEATMTGKQDLLDMIQLPERGASWESKPDGLSRIDTFNWLTCDEDHKDNQCAYMAYLNQKLNVPETHSLVDTQSQRTLLTVTFLQESEESRKIRGTTDVAIVTLQSSTNKTIRNNIETQFELKKPEKLRTKDHTPQVVGEHFAASYLNRHHPVVSVLTDLNNSWTFYWFARSDDGEMALFKLYLTGEAAATEAIYILDSLYDDGDDSRRKTLPITFSNRLSFEAVFQWVMKNKSKRGRGEQEEDDDGNGSTHHNKKKRDGKDQGEEVGGDSKPRQSNSEGCVRSSESGGTAHSNNQGGASMSMASALSLFAPPSSRDVANELDLLDMVDENEEYEIVRSFAMRHIVPYMRGQG